MAKAATRNDSLSDFRDRCDLVMEVVSNRFSMKNAFEIWMCGVNMDRMDRLMARNGFSLDNPDGAGAYGGAKGGGKASPSKGGKGKAVNVSYGAATESYYAAGEEHGEEWGGWYEPASPGPVGSPKGKGKDGKSNQEAAMAAYKAAQAKASAGRQTMNMSGKDGGKGVLPGKGPPGGKDWKGMGKDPYGKGGEAPMRARSTKAPPGMNPLRG